MRLGPQTQHRWEYKDNAGELYQRVLVTLELIKATERERVVIEAACTAMLHSTQPTGADMIESVCPYHDNPVRHRMLICCALDLRRMSILGRASGELAA